MSMIKKLLIGFGVVISAFLFTNSVNAATVVGGKNLLNHNNFVTQTEKLNVNIVNDELIIKRLSSGGSYVYFNLSNLEIGQNYTITANSRVYIYKDVIYGQAHASVDNASNGFTFVAEQSSYVIALIVGSGDIPNIGDTLNCGKIQLEKGNVATEYEPYYEIEKDLGDEIYITGYTYYTDVVYATLKNNGIDVSNYKYIIMSGYFYNSDKILIYLFNDTFTWLDVDARTGGVSESNRGAPSGINYTVVHYKSDNTIVKYGSYISNGYNGSGVANWYADDGYFMLSLNSSNIEAYSNYDTGITGVYGTVHNNYLTLTESDSSVYEFNEDIDVSDISKIKVNFNLPEDTRNLELKLDFSVKGLTENAGIIGIPYIALKSLDGDNTLTEILPLSYLTKEKIINNMCLMADCEQYKEYNTNPFEEMLTDISMTKVDLFLSNYGSVEFSKWDDFKELAQRLIDHNYCTDLYYFDSFNVNLLPDSTVYDYSLEINTIDYTGTLNLNFESNLNYSVSYEYESEVEDYYLTLDLNNYAAAVLIPKVINTNSSESNSFLSDIYLSGIYDIELWEDIDSKNVLFRHSNYSSNAFSHYFDYRYPNSVLYFIKKENFNGDSSIKIDTRYYSYLLLSTLSSGGTVINPNTNQQIIIPNISDLYDYDFEGDDITGIKDNVNFFFKNIGSLGEMILSPVQTFFDSLPPAMKVGIIVLFVLFLTVGIIKMNL